jgi:xanthine dehydrogenase accessory factor
VLDDKLVLIKGAGDLASGVAWRLHRCGFPVVMTELPQPMAVRRTVAFAQAVFDGEHTVEGLAARCCSVWDVPDVLAAGEIPVLVDPEAHAVAELTPSVVVDAIMAKRNTGTSPDHAPLVVALGPGFQAGVDCHAVVETNRGHQLGRVLWQGSSEPDTGIPGSLPGIGIQVTRVLRASTDGQVVPQREIGQMVRQGTVIATVQGPPGRSVPVLAPFNGVLRGLIHPDVPVMAGWKIGDLDPRARPVHCFSISDKSLAVAGAVLEAILSAQWREE